MIISISGKKNSGKDTVAKIIQYLYAMDDNSYTHPVSEKDFYHFIKNGHDKDSTWEIKKFADKLKRITCILIGCTREQLEDREFKEAPLGEEWWKYGVSWTSGKDEGSDGIFAIYEEAKQHALNIGATQEDIDDLQVITEIQMTPRKLMQLLGTESGREIIHPNIWVNALFASYPPDEIINKINSKTDGNYGVKQPDWIITDVRFPNELDAVKKHNGITIRINRFKKKSIREKYNTLIGKNKEHISETALDDYKDWDYVIENDGSLDDLIHKVKLIVNNIKNGLSISKKII